MQSNTKTRKFYNATSSIYEFLLKLLFDKARIKVANVINQQGGNVLDLGCHQGQLSKRLEPAVEYLGIDIANRAIARAKKNRHSPNHCFICSDAVNVLNQKSHFKNYVLLYFLSVCQSPDEIIAKISSNCRKGDQVFIVNHFSKNVFLGKLQNAVNKKVYLGFQFYFPLNLNLIKKHYNIVEQKNINWLWTYLHLERK